MSPALKGLRVLETGEGLAVAYAGRLLADQGATVVKMEPPDGDPLRWWRASAPDEVVTSMLDGGSSALFRFLNGAKQSVLSGSAGSHRWGSWADVELRGPDGAPAGPDPSGRDAAGPHHAGTAGVVVDISAFGSTGPLAGVAATEFTVQAWSGAVSARGAPDRPPLQQGGRVGEWLAGALGALAAMAGLSGRGGRPGPTGRASGPPVSLEVSMLEAMAVCLVTYPTLYRRFTGVAAALSQRGSDYPSAERCRDGWVGLCIFSSQQWADFAVMIDRPELAEDPRLTSMAARGANREFARSVIQPWLDRHTAEEIFELGGLFRVPVAYIGNGASLPAMEHFRARGTFVESPHGGFLQPRSPFRMSAAPVVDPGPAPEPGQCAVTPDTDDTPDSDGTPERDGTPARAATPQRPKPLAGVRVLDFTAYWAGPAGTHLLCALGAEVIKVESSRRPDGIRFATVAPPDSGDWLERSPIFQGTNPGKRSVGIDITRPEGRDLVLRLAAVCDGVWENFTPRVMENLHLTYADLAAVNPGLVMVRIPGFGLDGPWREHSGFAQTMEQVSGMGWLTGYPDGSPLVRTTCDPAAGIHAAFAFLAALRHRDRTGEGQLIEMAMADMAVNLTAEQVIEHSAYGVLLERQANRGPEGSPQGVYPCRGEERWVAISVVTDAQWEALVRLMGPDAPWADDPALATREGRRREADRVDAGLDAWTGGGDRDELVGRLLDAGVPAAPVWHQTEIDGHPQLVARRFFQECAHPTIGPVGYPGTGISSASVDLAYPGPAPLLGQHTAQVLTDLLGASEEELAVWAAAGVVDLV